MEQTAEQKISEKNKERVILMVEMDNMLLDIIKRRAGKQAISPEQWVEDYLETNIYKQLLRR